eukprot:2847768-Alexandrium_andersonii.AAC.1
MLLIEKLVPSDAQDQRWACLGAAKRAQVAQLRSKQVYALKAARGIVYSGAPTLTEEENTA